MKPLPLLLPAALLCAAMLAPLHTPLQAQSPVGFPTSWDPALMNRADIKSAMESLEKNFPQQVEEWIRLTEIPAKSGEEQARAAYVRAAFEQAGLANISTDSIGNVSGLRKGSGGGPTIAIMAHMDVVFDNDVPRKVRRSGDTLFAPGIGDNTASVADMLAMIRTMKSSGFKHKGDIIFIATVQEEIGLKGAKYWLDHNPAPDLLIVPDWFYGSVAYGALGIYWTKYTFTGEGSHTLNSRGQPTPVRAVAEAIDRIYALDIPPLPNGAVVNVGQIHGGLIYNSIPQELYFTVDLRTPDAALIDSLDKVITGIARSVAQKHKLGLEIEIPQRVEAGGTEAQLSGARAHPLVQTAVDINRFLGISPAQPSANDAVATGATDANPGVSAKIPSIAIAGSNAVGAHQLSEYALASSALPSTKLLYLLTATFADGIKTVAPAKVVP